MQSWKVACSNVDSREEIKALARPGLAWVKFLQFPAEEDQDGLGIGFREGAELPSSLVLTLADLAQLACSLFSLRAEPLSDGGCFIHSPTCSWSHPHFHCLVESCPSLNMVAPCREANLYVWSYPCGTPLYLLISVVTAHYLVVSPGPHLAPIWR